jgi:serine/threonine protein kinase/dipeptidyl aminopeptidase/acylaminoacyl peptidase
MSLSPGSLVGPYEIVAPIGAGGMGEVYRANDPRLHREVAIKVASARFTERTAREARTVAALNHPNICHIYDVGPDYLVMELVEGETLAERLKHGRIPLEEALAIVRQIAGALEAAHEKGIVHRDLKPGNIKIRPDGTVKVLDFGLAKGGEELSAAGNPENSPTLTVDQATRTGVIIGTAAYMAPEQARGKPVDKRADIWAFGVVLYEMLTGKRLFQGDTVTDTLAAVLTREPEWSLVPPKAERLLRRTLERDPKQRLRDIGDARFLLEDASPQAIPALRRGLPWKIATSASTLVSIVALVFLWLSTRHAAPPAVLRLSVDLGDDAALTPIRGLPMALSPDGSRIVFITGQQIVKSRLAVRRLDQAGALPLAGTEGAEAPFFSPDGKFVAFFADGKLKKIDAAGGTPATLCDAPSQREGSWGDDDNIVFAPTNLGGLMSVPANGGTPHVVTTLEEKDTHRFPQVLPGAQAVLFVNGLNSAGEGRIEVQPLKAGKRKILVQGGAYGRYLPSGHLVYMHRGTLYAVPMDLSRLELTGSPVPVLEDVGFEPGTGTAGFAFSRSGMFVYVAANPESQARPIGVMDPKGKLNLLPIERARYSHPRVSPDGTRLAVNVTTGQSVNVWIYEWGSQRFSRFPFPNGDSGYAIWTPDGKYLAFFSNAQTPGPGIYCMRADGAGAAVRLVEGANVVPNGFSPQAAQLLYETQGGVNAGVSVMPLDWSNATPPKPGVPKRVLEPFAEGPAAFSPDGQWLAYIDPRSGTPEVFVRPFRGAGGPWQISTGTSPVWSRTGRELFYKGVTGYRYRIMVTGYSVSGDAFSPAVPHPWNDTRIDSFDLMPDGKHVVVIQPAEQREATHATFLLNFMDDLRRRVPSGK